MDYVYNDYIVDGGGGWTCGRNTSLARHLNPDAIKRAQLVAGRRERGAMDFTTRPLPVVP